jgi:exodeoxyribonuclease V alpha subunit
LLVEQNKQLQSTENYRECLRILLAAPTGKAAIRLLDSLQSVQSTMDLTEQARAQMPKQASTLHKLLGYQPNSIQFKHNQDNPLPADIVVIDEASMIDIAMMAKLFAAVPKEATLILVGDKDQLSSVEIGSVFTDICNGLQNTNKLITLQKNWRFSNDSGIGQLSKCINKGDADVALSILESDVHSDCCLISPSTITPPKIPKLLIEPWLDYFKVLNHSSSTLDEIFSAFNEYRVLCALRRGLNGSQLLTDRIETEITKLSYIKKNQQTARTSSSWYHGRPIMITQNSYSRGLYNGDVGIALLVDKQIKVFFPNSNQSPDDDNMNQGNYKSFAPVRLPAHETTWAMTIHKSQGSEFNQVALVLPDEVMPLLTKQLIYTGVTRAKKQVSIIVEADILNAGIKIEASQATRVGEALSSALL